MIWLIYDILTGLVQKTQIEEPTNLLERQAKAKSNIVQLGEELTNIIEVQEVNLETLVITQIVSTQRAEAYLAFQNAEKSITELEIRDIEKDITITDMEIAIIELRGGVK